MTFEIYIDKNYPKRTLDIYIYAKNGQDQVFKVEPVDIIISTIDDPTVKIDPFMSIGYMDAEPFLNAFSKALTQSGYKDEAISKDGEIKRIEEHLKDMREITFKFINKED